MYSGMGPSSSNSQSNSGDAASSASGSGESSDSQSGSGGASSSGSNMNGYNSAMFGFPPGFRPSYYGLDWDSNVKDCMDDSACAQGLTMYTQGRNMGNSITNMFQQYLFGQQSRLQRPRRLSRPRYGVPYRYGRQY